MLRAYLFRIRLCEGQGRDEEVQAGSAIEGGTHAEATAASRENLGSRALASLPRCSGRVFNNLAQGRAIGDGGTVAAKRALIDLGFFLSSAALAASGGGRTCDQDVVSAHCAGRRVDDCARTV